METIEDMINKIDELPNDTNEKIRTARSNFRTELIELLKVVNDTKRPTTEITYRTKNLPNVLASWVGIDMDIVYRTTAMPLDQSKVEEQNKHMEIGISAEDME